MFCLWVCLPIFPFLRVCQWLKPMNLLGHIWNLSLISLILFRREKISFSLEIISSSEAKKIIAFCPRLFKTMVLCSSVKEGIRIPGIQDQGLKFGVQTFIHMPSQTTQKKGNKSLNFFHSFKSTKSRINAHCSISRTCVSTWEHFQKNRLFCLQVLKFPLLFVLFYAYASVSSLCFFMVTLESDLIVFYFLHQQHKTEETNHFIFFSFGEVYRTNELNDSSSIIIIASLWSFVHPVSVCYPMFASDRLWEREQSLSCVRHQMRLPSLRFPPFSPS